MRIVVCVKHVPDIQSDRQLTEAGRVDRSGEMVLNELDENAIEQALETVESLGGKDHEVIAVTVGPKEAAVAVRKALQLGAHRGVHVSDDAIAGSDVFATAKVLAGTIRAIDRETPVDVVLTGMAALDGLTSLMPAVLGGELNWPELTVASDVKIDAESNTVAITRELDHVIETLEADLPAVISVTDQINEPRYPNFRAMMAARKKSVSTLALADIDVYPDDVRTTAARTTVTESRARPEREHGLIVTDPSEGAKQLASWLVENNLVSRSHAALYTPE